MTQEHCKVLENSKVAPGHYVMRLASAQIGRRARPGQFVQILCADSNDPLLPRPFSFLEADAKSFSILYHVVGRGTSILETVKKGDTLKILGPLGNGFGGVDGRRNTVDKTAALLVGGGVGIPPLYHWAKVMIAEKRKKPSEIHVFLGARDKSLLLLEKEFKKLGAPLHIATDNGSKGHQGFVTELLQRHLSSVSRLPSSVIYTCGPTPMMRAAAALSEKYGVSCEVSVEVPMACGFGACLGCAVKVKNTGDGRRDTAKGQRDAHSTSSEVRYAMACCEGPVFKGNQLCWE